MPCASECDPIPTPILKSREKMDSESDGGESVTSSECTDSDHGDDSDVDDIKARVAAANRKIFSTKHRYKPPVKGSFKKKKRVSFKPGDKLVLIYEIPNRAMLGLKSDSETSDDSGNDDDDDEDDDDDDDDEGEEDEDGEDDESEDVKNVKNNKKMYPRRNTSELRERRQQEKVAKLIGLRISPVPGLNSRSKRNKVPIRVRPERKEWRVRAIKKDNLDVNGNSGSETKPRRGRRRRDDRGIGAFPNLRRDADKSGKSKRTRSSNNSSRIVEIKGTLQQFQSQSNNTRLLTNKQDLKPAIATLDSHGGISVNSNKHLPSRPKIQPATFRLAKTRPRPESVAMTESVTVPLVATQRLPVRQVMSASLDETSYKRLDPDCMNMKNKRFYAWQVANGNITTNQLRTPSILPFLESLQISPSDSNSVKFPT